MRPCVKWMVTGEDISRSEMAAARSVLGTEVARRCFLEIRENNTRGVADGNEVVQEEK